MPDQLLSLLIPIVFCTLSLPEQAEDVASVRDNVNGMTCILYFYILLLLLSFKSLPVHTHTDSKTMCAFFPGVPAVWENLAGCLGLKSISLYRQLGLFNCKVHFC